MRHAAVLAALCSLGVGALSLGGCEQAAEAAAERSPLSAAQAAAPQAPPAGVAAGGRYDFDALVAEGLARDKAVLDSGWKPRMPEPTLETAAAPPDFPMVAPVAPPAAAAIAAAPANVQVFGGRAGRGGRREGAGGRGLRGRDGYPSGFSGPAGAAAGFTAGDGGPAGGLAIRADPEARERLADVRPPRD